MSYYISIIEEVNKAGEISIEKLSKTFGLTNTRTEYYINKGINEGYLEKYVNSSKLSVRKRYYTKYRSI
jgi:hypothetical protein